MIWVMLVLLLSTIVSDTIVELTASHTRPQPYPQIWQGQVDDTVMIEVPDSVSKIFMMGKGVKVIL